MAELSLIGGQLNGTQIAVASPTPQLEWRRLKTLPPGEFARLIREPVSVRDRLPNEVYVLDCQIGDLWMYRFNREE